MRVLFMLKLIVLIIGCTTLLSSQSSLSAYHSYDDMTATLKSLQSRYSSVLHLESIGKTSGGRDIWVAALRKGDPAGHRALLIVAGVEPVQVSGSELALRAIEHLASSYGKVDSVTRLLDAATIYVIPRVNPDASESFFAPLKVERSTNDIPYDGDRDGAVDEDDVEDLNGDRMISLMRVRDPLGTWMPHPEDARVLKKANAAVDEKGMYRVFAEGTDNDKDERWNEDPVGGVNFNRNFTFNYEFFGDRSGAYQVSEPESRAVADFVFSHPSIAVVFSFSPNDNLMTPWKSEGRPTGETRVVSSISKEDEEYYQHVSKRFQQMTGFKDAPKPEKGAGAFSDWAYYHAGRWSFSTYPWWASELRSVKDTASADANRRGGSGASTVRPPREDAADDASTRQVRTLRWYQAAGIGDAFVPWKAFRHPDFPGQEVEIGGLKPFAMDNPPAESLATASTAFNNFFIDLASKLPSVAIEKVKVEALRSGVYRVSADIANHGYFPTSSSLGDRVRWVRNVAVTVGLDKSQSIASGKARQVVGPIAGRGATIPLSWVVVAPAGSTVTLTAESPSSGTATQRIELRERKESRP